MSTKKTIICFMGVDGSGKTTQAKNLLMFLRKHGYSSKYMRVASRPILIYPFLAATRILGYWNTVKEDAWTNPLEKAPLQIKKKLGMLYRFFLFVDFEIIALLRLRLPLLYARVAICDRYSYDLIIDLALSDLLSERFTDLILRSTAKPEMTFFMDSPPRAILSRRPNFDEENMITKINAYRNLAKTLDFKVIDTTLRKEENQAYIRTQVRQLLEEY